MGSALFQATHGLNMVCIYRFFFAFEPAQADEALELRALAPARGPAYPRFANLFCTSFPNEEHIHHLQTRCPAERSDQTNLSTLVSS